MKFFTLLANASDAGKPFWDNVLESVVYALLGLILFGITFFVITKLTPFSLKKEIEEDQNTALAILIGSVMLGLAIILGASIAG
jgi:putative membrane protein